jgi:hypothetical protein
VCDSELRVVSLAPTRTRDQIADEIPEGDLLPMDFHVGQQRGDVVRRRFPPRFEQFAGEGEEIGERCRHGFGALAEIRIVLAHEGVGPVIELGPEIGRQAQQFAQRQQGRGADSGTRSTSSPSGIAATRCSTRVRMRASIAEPCWRDRRHDVLAVLGVDRWIARDEGDADRAFARARQPNLVLVENAVASVFVGAGEQGGVARYLHDVGMAQHRPEARTVAFRVPVHGSSCRSRANASHGTPCSNRRASFRSMGLEAMARASLIRTRP